MTNYLKIDVKTIFMNIFIKMLTPVTAFVNRHEKFFFERRYFRFFFFFMVAFYQLICYTLYIVMDLLLFTWH